MGTKRWGLVQIDETAPLQGVCDKWDRWTIDMQQMGKSLGVVNLLEIGLQAGPI
jgi:hypothetical protein